MLQSEDPGAGLAEMILSSGILDRPLEAGTLSAPIQRRLGKRIGLRRKFPGRPAREVSGWTFHGAGLGLHLLSGRAAQIEAVLCTEDSTPERCIKIARLALEHGHPDAAATWTERVIATQPSSKFSEAYRLHGLALAESGQLDRMVGHRASTALSQLAEQALRQAEEALDPSTPPEDALALYATRAGCLMVLGRDSEVEQPLEQALRLINMPSARMKDIVSVARVLLATTRPERAEEILKRALERAADATDQARIRIALGWCEFDLGRIDEALSIAEAVLREQERYYTDANWEVRAGASDLRVRALLTRHEPERALALCDAELTRAADRWGRASPRAVFWMPMLARALRHAGRAGDAEMILRRLLNLPLKFDATRVALGLSSKIAVLSFLSAPHGLNIAPRQRRELWGDLVQALRAQGRHLEADDMERRRDKDDPT
jgi:tetratricopeptide (TPR) repeat protein